MESDDRWKLGREGRRRAEEKKEGEADDSLVIGIWSSLAYSCKLVYTQSMELTVQGEIDIIVSLHDHTLSSS
jgi:hypothetical protein